MFGTTLVTEPTWLEWAFRIGPPLIMWPVLPFLICWRYERTWPFWWSLSAFSAAFVWMASAFGFFGWPLYAKWIPVAFFVSVALALLTWYVDYRNAREDAQER